MTAKYFIHVGFRDCGKFGRINTVKATAGGNGAGDRRHAGCAIEPPAPHRLAAAVAIQAGSPGQGEPHQGNITLSLRKFVTTTELHTDLEWREGYGYDLRVTAGHPDHPNARLDFRGTSLNRKLDCLHVTSFVKETNPTQMLLKINDICDN